jgi:hypothetical protein
VGDSFQITVGGQFLDGINAAHFSGKGVRATLVQYTKPLTQQQFNRLREQLSELLDRRATAMKMAYRPAAALPASKPSTRPTWTANDDKTIAEIRAKLATFVRKPSSPAIAEQVVIKIEIAADADVGEHDLRLITPNGLTNPLVFCVGQLAEFTEGEGKGAAMSETSVTIPAVMNGQIMPGDVDRYRFQAKRGQHLVVTTAARSLVPYLADAVPGWFQATLALYDAKGVELAYDDDFRFDPDPVLYYVIPSDGEYVVEIKDAIYRGREDFVYRITVGEMPFVTSIFPLGGPAGAKTNIELRGWNLATPTFTMDAKDKSPGVYPVAAHRGGRVSNQALFAVDSLPELAEKEPNDKPGQAQSVTLPVIVNGRIGKPGDTDVYRFDGNAGDAIVAEVQARRLNSPVDSVVEITDASGHRVAFNDDQEDKGAGLQTHHADSRVATTLPSSGTFYLRLEDAQHGGGAEYAYRLRISPPQPDFALRIEPSGITARAGSTIPLTVYALRKDGFSGPIELSFKDAPAGFVFSGARVPPGQDQVTLTLTVPNTVPEQLLTLSVVGRARIGEREVVHDAVATDLMMQAFAYLHLVPAQELLVDVTAARRTFRSPFPVRPTPTAKIPAGGTVAAHVSVPQASFFGKLHIQLSEAPEGVSIQSFSATREGIDLVLRGDASKLKPGTQGNLIVTMAVERGTSPSQKKAAAPARPPVGYMPAIPFEVVTGPGERLPR